MLALDMTKHLLFLAALAPLVVAYSNTSPLLTWSSSRSEAIEALPASAARASVILDSILSNDDICKYDAVILVQHPGLHASDLRTLTPDTGLAHALTHSSSSRSYPYTFNDESGYLLSSLAPTLADKCDSRLLQYSAGESGIVLDSQSKHVVHLQMPELKADGQARKHEIDDQEHTLSEELSALANAFPYHLVVYAGLPVSMHLERALSPFDAPVNTTLPTGGILKRYQLLTPGLITVLLIVLFVLLPVLWVGINALASIQNPIKMDIPKNYSAQERKNQ